VLSEGFAGGRKVSLTGGGGMVDVEGGLVLHAVMGKTTLNKVAPTSLLLDVLVIRAGLL